MSEKNILELLKDLQQLKQENNALKSLCNNKAAENEKLSERLHSFEWMFIKKQTAAMQYVADYGDLSRLNKNGLIKKSIQKDQLQDIVSEYFDLLETSAAIYEKNGDYAMGIFSSGWCQRMDSASRRLCNTDDNRKALASGKWLCHDSCWRDASLKSMNEGKPAEVACNGGLHLYAVPVWANNQIIGAINFGFGSSPKEDAELKKLSTKFKVPLKELRGHSTAYNDRPHFIIDYAKQRIQNSAKYLGYLVERKMAEEALRQSNDIVEYIQVGLYIYYLEDINDDRTLRLKFANPASEAITGLKAENITGKTLDENFPNLREMNVLQRYAEVVRSAQMRTFEDIGYGDNRIMQSCYSVKAFPLPNNHVGIAFEDITEKVSIQDLIAHSNMRLKEAQEVGNIGSWEYNVLNDIIVWSDQTYLIYGEDPDDFKLTFNEVIDRYPENDREQVLKAFNEALDGKSDFSIDHRILTNSGEIRFVQQKAKVVLNDDGNPLRLIGSVIDITERKNVEEALMAKMNELERFSKLTVGRELTMVELKKEVNNLLNKSGEENKYKIVE